MKKVCDFYIKHVSLIGALYCAVPVTVALIAGLVMVEQFRDVYFLRYGLCITLGSGLGAYLNKHGLEMWISRHRGSMGPGTVLQGAVVGAKIGILQAFFPGLLALIGSNHPDLAMKYIVASSLIATVLGFLFGTVLSLVGRKYIERETPA
ncbi:MAG: hypothetical protein GY754_44005 [bacterium]|nr:hypothetical protein [bacterium]